MLLDGVWVPHLRAWPGIDADAVTLAPAFSPLVEPTTIRAIEEETARLRGASGDAAFHSIFCGPLLKRWAYDFADGTAGPRARWCSGGNPVWRRLEPPEQIDLRHYHDMHGQPLPSNQTTPLASDCLTREALLGWAFPTGAFAEADVHNDYLLDGIELVIAQTTAFGTVHAAQYPGSPSTGECGAAGDRFFTATPVAIPPSPPPPAQPLEAASDETAQTIALVILSLGSSIAGAILLSRLVHLAPRWRASILQRARQRQRLENEVLEGQLVSMLSDHTEEEFMCELERAQREARVLGVEPSSSCEFHFLHAEFIRSLDLRAVASRRTQTHAARVHKVPSDVKRGVGGSKSLDAREGGKSQRVPLERAQITQTQMFAGGFHRFAAMASISKAARRFSTMATSSDHSSTLGGNSHTPPSITRLTNYQDLRRDHPEAFETRTITLREACLGSLRQTTLVISHRWETSEVADVSGDQLLSIQEHLRENLSIGYVWVDVMCLPQGQRTSEEKVEFETMLRHTNLLYLGASVLVVADLSYVSRWCVASSDEALP